MSKPLTAADLKQRGMETIVLPGLRSGEVIRLVAKQDVYLLVYAGDGPRFARLFRETWARIPLWARRRMLKHWRTEEMMPLLIKPTIELTSGWSGRRTGRGLRGDKAAVYLAGCQLRFWSRIVDAYPDEIVRDLIAHELAHVVQMTQGWPVITEDVLETELDADEKAEEWGFSVNAMDEWDEEHGVYPKLDLSKLTPAQRKRAELSAIRHRFKYGR